MVDDVRFKLPKGFKRHHGDGCPVAGDQYVEAIVRTAEGYGSSGVMRADRHDWNFETHEPEGGLGEVVGYRLAVRGELPRHGEFERF
jgi:hypothetical protein